MGEFCQGQTSVHQQGYKTFTLLSCNFCVLVFSLNSSRACWAFFSSLKIAVKSSGFNGTEHVLNPPPPPAPPPPLSPSPSPSPSPTPFPRVPLRARETRFAGYEDDVKMEQLTSHTRAGRHKCQHYFRYSRAFFCLLELVLLFCRRYHRRPRSCLAKTPQCLT